MRIIFTGPPTRQEYQAAVRAMRACSPQRSERGLPHHPDGSGLATCPDCEGAGERVQEHQDGQGYTDPQLETTDECARCLGEGYVLDGFVDPIFSLRRLRRARRQGAINAYLYGAALQRVVSPVVLP